MSNDFILRLGTEVDTSQKEIQDQINKKVKEVNINTKIKVSDNSKELYKQRKQYVSFWETAIGDRESNERQAELNISKLKEIAAKKNLSAYDMEIKKAKELAKFNSNAIKSQIQERGNSDSSDIIKMRADTANKNFQAYLKNLNPQALKVYASEIRNISKSFESVQESGDKVSLNKANASLSQFKGNMKAAGNETATFTQIIKDNIASFTNWYFIGNAVSSVVRNFKQAITTLIEVDTLLTEISKTSEISAANLKKLGIEAYDYASKFGQTVQGYLQGVQEMSRAGYDETQSKALAELSILAQSAGDMTAELANEYIIATNAAYKLEGNVAKLNAVLDSQNQVSNRNAISMEKIAEATKIAGSQSASSGVEVNQLTAAISTMGVVTQSSGETLGRAFKGILMNLQAVKGETEDGEIIDEESLSKVEKAADALGVKLKEVRNGVLSLRDPMVVLKELANEYSKLSDGDVRGANLISALGGKYRSNELNALLSNYSMYEKILSDYENASGSAASEAQKTADSIEGRLNTLSNTWNRTVANVVDSDILKAFLSIGTGAIDLIDNLELLQTALVAFGVVGTYKVGSGLISWLTSAVSSTLAFGNALNTVKVSSFVSNTENLANAIQGLTVSQASAVLSTKQLQYAEIETAMTTAGFTASEAANTAATLTMSNAQGVATGTTLTLGTAFKSLTAAMMANPIGLIITGITVAVSALSFGLNKYKQSQDEVISAIKTHAEEANSLSDEISTLILKYKDLSEAVKTDAGAKDTLLITQNELLAKLGLEGQSIEELTKKYGSLSEAINKVSLDNLKSAEIDLVTNYGLAEKDLLNNAKNIGFKGNVVKDDYLKSFNILKDAGILDFGDMGFSISADTSSKNGILEYYKKIEDAMRQLRDSGKYTTAELTNDKVWNMLNSQYDSLTPLVNEYNNSIAELNSNLSNQYMIMALQGQELPKTTGEFEALKQQLISAVDASGKFIGSEEDMVASIENILSKQPQFSSFFSTITTGASTYSESILSLSDALEAMSDSGKALDDLKKEISELGYISSDTLGSLISKYPQLEKVVASYNAGLASTEDVLNELGDAYKTDYDNYRKSVLNKVSESEDFYTKALTNLPTWVQNLADAYDIDFSNYKNLTEAKLKLDHEYNRRVASLQAAQKASDIFTETASNSGSAYDISAAIRSRNHIQESKKALEEYTSLVEGFNTSIDGTLNLSGYKPSSVDKEKKSSSDNKTDYFQEIDWIKTRFDAVERSVSKLNDAYSNADTDNQVAALEKLIAKQEKLTGIYKNGAKEYRNQYESNLATIKKLGFNAEEIFNKIKWGANSVDIFKDLKIDSDKTGIQEQLYNAIQSAVSNWNSYSSAVDNKVKVEYEIKDNKKELNELYRNIGLSGIENSLSGLKETNDELDTMVTLLGDVTVYDEFGKLTANGAAKLTLLNSQLSTAEESTKLYSEQIKILNEQYLEGLWTSGEYHEKLKELKSEYRSAVTDLNSYKQAIISLVVDGINAETTAYKDQIDKIVEVLEKKKNLEDSNKSLLEKQKKLAILQKQINAFSTDESNRENNAQRLKLEEEYAKLKEEIDDEVADNAHKTTVDSLKEQADAFEKAQDKKISELKNSLSQQEYAISNSLDIVSGKYESVYKNLVDLAASYGIQISNALTNPLESAMSSVATTGTSGNSKVNSSVYSVLTKNTSGEKQTAETGLNQYLISKGYNKLSWDEMVNLANALGLTDITKSDVVNSGAIRGKILNKLKESGFNDGGYPIFPKLVKATGEDGIALVKRGEPILNKEQGVLFKDLVANLKPLNNLTNYALNPYVLKSPNNLSNSISVDMPFTINGTGIDESQIKKMTADIKKDVTNIVGDYLTKNKR